MNELRLKKGERVVCNGRYYTIKAVLNFSEVLCDDEETGEKVINKIEDLTCSTPAQSDESVFSIKKDGEERNTEEHIEISTLSDKEWGSAERKLEIIKPILELYRPTKEEIRKHAKNNSVGVSTIYRWLSEYRNSGRVTSLINAKPTGGRGKSRLDPDVEKILDEEIQKRYLTEHKRKVKSVHRKVKTICKNANLPPPSEDTVRYRVNKFLTEREKVQGREGVDTARQLFEPRPGKYEEADTPHAVVEIDHTQLDIILVDDLERLPIGRPWITVAIDVFSRMILGYYISFDEPSSASTGLCIIHAILPKEKWLKKFNIEALYPVWGPINLLHADNDGTFRSEMLRRSGLEHSINIKWRPLKRTYYGGHIERLLGTFNNDIHELDGTTKSNPTDRGEYNSDKEATMTFSEFEEWLANYIVCDYHQSFHSGINMSPLKKYDEGINGTKDSSARGLLPRIATIEDEERLRLDFMPLEERIIHPFGVLIDHIKYYHPVLNRYIGDISPENPKAKRKFTFKRDPRNISVIYFYDPSKCYYPIPYRNTSYPAISVWELRRNIDWLKDKGYKDIDEDLIFRARERRQQIEDEARRKTKIQRKENQRRRLHEQNAQPLLRTSQATNIDLPEADSDKSLPTDIEPYDEIIEL